MTTIPTATLLWHIALLTEIQKRNSPKTQEWQNANACVHPLFEEMARRQRLNDMEPDHTKWTRL